MKNCLPLWELKRKKLLNHGFRLLEKVLDSHGKGETPSSEQPHSPLESSAHSLICLPPGQHPTQQQLHDTALPTEIEPRALEEDWGRYSVSFFQQKTIQDSHNLSMSMVARVVTTNAACGVSKGREREMVRYYNTNDTRIQHIASHKFKIRFFLLPVLLQAINLLCFAEEGISIAISICCSELY